MPIDELDPITMPAEVADSLARVVNAAARVDAPHLHPVSGTHVRLDLQYGRYNRPSDHTFAATLGTGEVVGLAELNFPVWDNHDVARLEITVDPDHRDTDLDEALLERMLAIVKASGRRRLLSGGWVGSDGEKFWKRHDFALASRAAQRRLVMADLDWLHLDHLYYQSLAASADYDVVALPMPAPADTVPGLLDLHRAMNDSPLDDLDVEDEIWDETRLRCYEQEMDSRRMRLHRLLARRRRDGVLGGHTIVAIEEERPRLGFQEDTAVIQGHRGHKLGLRLKLEMLRRLRTLEPQIETLDTWNVESNTHMIAVNDALGFVVAGRAVDFQKKLMS